MDNIVYLNGELIPRRQARISALDYGFLYGFGLFETMRAYEGRVFRLDRHINRLAESAGLLDLSIDKVEIERAILDTIKVNKLANARVRITVSPGEGAINAEPASCQQPTLLVIAEGYKPYPQQIYSKGLRVVLSKIRRNSQSGLSRLKSTSYLQSIMARQEARAAAADEAICLNEKGLLAEAGMSNIFLVTDSMLKTPHLESGILPGITRQAILELAFRLGIKNLECDIKSEELYRAQEAFLTGSLIEVMPLIAVDDIKIGNAKPGPVTCRLMTAYGELVVSELEIR